MMLAHAVRAGVGGWLRHAGAVLRRWFVEQAMRCECVDCRRAELRSELNWWLLLAASAAFAAAALTRGAS